MALWQYGSMIMKLLMAEAIMINLFLLVLLVMQLKEQLKILLQAKANSIKRELLEFCLRSFRYFLARSVQ